MAAMGSSDEATSASDSPADQLHIKIKTLDNSTYELDVNPQANVAQLKALVTETTSVQQENQRLIYRGRVLRDSDPLTDYSLEDGHTVHLITKRPGHERPARTMSEGNDHDRQNNNGLGGHSDTLNDAAAARRRAVAAVMGPLGSLGNLAGGGDPSGGFDVRRVVSGVVGRPRRGTVPAPGPESLEHVRQALFTMETLISGAETSAALSGAGMLPSNNVSLPTPPEAKVEEGALESKTPDDVPSPPHNRCFFVGQWLDVKDTVNQWLEATVMQVTESALKIHYNGWETRWDEWIPKNSSRLAPFRTVTTSSNTTHASPSPDTWVGAAPRTGADDTRAMLGEVMSMMNRISPVLQNVHRLSQFRAPRSETSPDNSENNDDTPSTAPVAIQWANHADYEAPSGIPLDDMEELEESDAQQLAAVATALAPILDRFGRALADMAPHLLSLASTLAPPTDAADAADAVAAAAAPPSPALNAMPASSPMVARASSVPATPPSSAAAGTSTSSPARTPAESEAAAAAAMQLLGTPIAASAAPGSSVSASSPSGGVVGGDNSRRRRAVASPSDPVEPFGQLIRPAARSEREGAVDIHIHAYVTPASAQVPRRTAAAATAAATAPPPAPSMGSAVAAAAPASSGATVSTSAAPAPAAARLPMLRNPSVQRTILTQTAAARRSAIADEDETSAMEETDPHMARVLELQRFLDSTGSGEAVPVPAATTLAATGAAAAAAAPAPAPVPTTTRSSEARTAQGRGGMLGLLSRTLRRGSRTRQNTAAEEAALEDDLDDAEAASAPAPAPDQQQQAGGRRRSWTARFGNSSRNE